MPIKPNKSNKLFQESSDNIDDSQNIIDVSKLIINKLSGGVKKKRKKNRF